MADAPFVRQFGPGAVGTDVRAVKRALIKAGYGEGVTDTDTFGAQAQAALVAFKTKHGLLADPLYTRQAHYYLDPYFDVTGIALLLEEQSVLLRAEYVKVQNWGPPHTAEFTYDEVRPIPVGLKPFTGPVVTDCSGWVILSAKWAGAPDPSGNGFSGDGNTDSLLAHCRKVTKSAVRPSDLALFLRPGDTHHVAAIVGVVGARFDFDIVNFGKPGEPVAKTFSAEQEAQTAEGYGEYVFLRFLS